MLGGIQLESTDMRGRDKPLVFQITYGIDSAKRDLTLRMFYQDFIDIFEV